MLGSGRVFGHATRRRIGIAVVGAAAIAVVGVTSATASMAPHAQLAAAMRARIPSGWSLPGSFGLRPALAGPVNESLTSAPTTVTIAGVAYRMQLDVETFTGAGPVPPSVSVELSRGSATHTQIHEYGFQPTKPVTFSVNQKTMGASVNTGTLIAPSAIATVFKPTKVTSRTCGLGGGATGTYRSATGTLTTSAFKIATGTTPFFGTITTKPTTATLVIDPGCTTGGGGGASLPCPSSEQLQPAGNGPLTTGWFAATVPGSSSAQLVAVNVPAALTAVEQPFHLIGEVVPAADLPAPTAGATGATARILTTGAVFLRGSAIFTSTKAPKTTTGSCTLAGKKHTYSMRAYTGTLKAGTPALLALFDTGRKTLVSMPAELDLTRLTS